MKVERFRAATLAAFLLFGAVPASAQGTASDPDTAQVVGLFEQTCMQFAGNVAGLRSWAAQHNLPPVPGQQAAMFLGEGHAGQVFGASTASGKHAVVSDDSGACQVVALSGYASAVQQRLEADLGRKGFSLTRGSGGTKPDGSSEQQLYRASLGNRHWLLSLTSKPHPGAPNLAPELHLAATIDENPTARAR